MTFVNIKLLLLGIFLFSSFYITEVFAQDEGIAVLNSLIKPTTSSSNRTSSYKLKEDEKNILKVKSNKVAENIKKKKAEKYKKNHTIKKTREFSDALPSLALSSQHFDVDKAARALNRNARGKSTGYCAKYVRLAMEAGGLKLIKHPVAASDYDEYLPSLGFKKIEKDENYLPKKGDIVVTKAFKGKKNHPYGHISMYNGEQWVSDFKQKDIWAGNDYRTHKPKQIIFRKG